MAPLILEAAMIILTACSPKADYDVRGTWTYTILAPNGDTFDTGAITFRGEQRNIYNVDYEGEYTVKGAAIALTGDEVWQGTVTGPNQMGGTWVHEDETDGNGTWSAIKQDD
jgi:hypothetical protein